MNFPRFTEVGKHQIYKNISGVRIYNQDKEGLWTQGLPGAETTDMCHHTSFLSSILCLLAMFILGLS